MIPGVKTNGQGINGPTNGPGPKRRPRPFKLRAPVAPELDIHVAVFEALDRLMDPRAVIACYPAGHIQLTPQQAARLARAGLRRGMPDLLIWYEGCWGLEVKREKGSRLSKTTIGRTRSGAPKILVGQEEMFPRLMASGGFNAIGIVHSIEEAIAQVKAWGIPVRGHSL